MERIEGPQLGASRLWRNPSVSRLVWLLIVTVAAGTLALWLYADRSAGRLQQDWLDRQMAIVGHLSASDPMKAREWASVLAKPESLTAQDEIRGRKLAEQYGFTPQIQLPLSPILRAYSDRTLAVLASGFFALIAVLGILLLREYRRQLTDIRKLAVSLENAVKHNQPMSFRLYGEGEIGLLASSVQELAIRLQETIKQLHRDKNFLKDTVSDISHQLKTPLSSLIIYVDLLREGKADPVSAQEFLETCRRELDRMEWLILTLLKIARLEADALPLQIRPAPIMEAVERACGAVRRLAEERGVDLAVAPPGFAAEPIPHDVRWLGEAIANLLKNAVEHSPPGGRVTVGWTSTAVFLRLYVEDQGPGIDDKHLPHVFRKFYRVSQGGSGVGLGLPLAKTIVERHGGMLSASASAAEGPGHGARFVLTLPRHPLPSDDFAKAYKTVSEDPADL